MKLSAVTMSQEYLGVGDNSTWHGAPDGRADWAPVHSVESDSDESEVDQSQSPGRKTSYEAKRTFRSDDIDQLVAHAVITSYVHSNRHPEQNHLIPAIAVSGLDGEVMAIMYDSYHDVMLHIHPLNWIDVTNNLYVDCGVFILWLLLHHRLFLRGISQFDLPKAQLVNIFTQLNVLGHYKSLTNYNVVDWPKRLTPLGYMRTKRISLGEESISTPQVKKTKSNTDELGK